MSELSHGLRYHTVPVAAALLLSISGCQAPETQSVTECVLTQPSLVGAKSINGYPTAPQGGILFETIHPYGVTAQEFDKNYIGATATSKVIKQQLRDSETIQGHSHTSELNNTSIIAFCFTVDDLSKPGAKGKVWPYTTPTAGQFGTVAVRKTTDIPGYFRSVLKSYPNATAFRVNSAQTELSPLEYQG